MYREQIIIDLARGKDVLDIGSVGQDCETFTGGLVAQPKEKSQQFKLWRMLKEAARSLTGIDPEAPEGGEVTRGDMETHQFHKTFDVIIAGDVLEHVSNQGLFLRNIHRHLTPGGTLLITTPNAKWPTVFLKPNETHTFWHDQHTLRHMLSREGFKVERLDYYPGNKPSYPWWQIPLLLRQGMLVIATHA